MGLEQVNTKADVCISYFLASCRYQHSTNMVVCATWNTSLILLLYRQYIEGHWPHNSCLMWGFVGYCFLISCHQVNSPWRSTKYFFFSSCSLDRHCQSSPSFLYIAIKVQIFLEGHKTLAHLPLFIWHYLKSVQLLPEMKISEKYASGP